MALMLSTGFNGFPSTTTPAYPGQGTGRSPKGLLIRHNLQLLKFLPLQGGGQEGLTLPLKGRDVC